MMDRRNFLQSSAVFAGAFMLPKPLTLKQDPIKLAMLGTGWWGHDILLNNSLATGQFEIVALCDVDSIALNRAAETVVKAGQEKPKLFSSYQEMYALPGLEAVAIATPTHWHALHFIDACKAGLHVFLEKPISYDIREGQAMVEAQRKAKNVVQVDFPRVMGDTNDQVQDFIQSGEAGKIYQVQANIHNPEGNLVEKPIPDTIDFDTYCGPAPLKKFMCSANGNRPIWRGQHDFSRGVLMDWGIHYIHNVRKIMDLGLPDKVMATGGITKRFGQDNPDYLDVHFDFGGLPVCWTHKSWGFTPTNPDHRIGVYYFGDKATIFSGDLGWEVYPAGGKEKILHGETVRFVTNEKTMPIYMKMMQDLFTEFAEGVRTKSNAGITNKLEDACLTTSTVIFADLSYQVNAQISIDGSSMDIKDQKEAKHMLKRAYRKPYKHPYKA